MEDYLYQKDLFLPLGEIVKKSVASSVGGFQYFQRKYNEGFDVRIGQIV
jgi:hypothetical protein